MVEAMVYDFASDLRQDTQHRAKKQLHPIQFGEPTCPGATYRGQEESSQVHRWLKGSYIAGELARAWMMIPIGCISGTPYANCWQWHLPQQ